jgi:two-component system, LytTR family, response regulator
MAEDRVRTLVVDDEPLARRRLCRLLRADPSVKVVGECGDGAAAVEAVERLAPDLMLLDVQMPGVDGFGVLEALPRDRWPVVVFVTAYDQHAVRAFEVHALDYLLKPVEPARFAEAVGRAVEHVRLRRAGRPGQSEKVAALVEGRPAAVAPYGKYLLVRDGGRLVPVRVAEIDWAEAAGKHVRLHVGGKAHVVREGLARLAARLDPSQFPRIHRSALVNLRCIQEIEPAFHGDCTVLLHDGTRLTLSRTYRAAFHRLFGEPG